MNHLAQTGDGAKIRVENVSMVFEVGGGREVHALDGVSIDVRDGELLVIVGPSGCGKSTLLYIIAGLVEATGGRVLVDGQEVQGPSVQCGMVFQGDAVFPWMTVRQNLAFGPTMKGLPKAERARIVNHYLELVNLQDYGHLWPKQLSGGMKKRVDLARAYANNPQTLLMDEPFGALDVLTKEEMQIELQKLFMVEGGRKTVIFVTHDLEEALFLGDRVAVMTGRPGRIQRIVDVPFARPRHASIKTDLAFTTMRAELGQLLHGGGRAEVLYGPEGVGH